LPEGVIVLADAAGEGEHVDAAEAGGHGTDLRSSRWRNTAQPSRNTIQLGCHSARSGSMLARLCNPIGIRRWFARSRQALAGATPLALLEGNWLPEHPGPQRLKALAAATQAGMVAS
jgi:hypothetical protein